MKEKYGDWALVTGASSGVGKAMALEIASFGINVVIAARRDEELNRVKKQLQAKYDVEVIIVVVDFSLEDACLKLMQACENIEIGLLVNNVGYALTGNFLDNSIEEELALINVNIKTPILLSHHFAGSMKERKKGGIIFLSSIMSFAGAASWAIYNASKSQNLVFSEGLSEELAPYNIDVIALTPGAIQTGFSKRSNTKMLAGSLLPSEVAHSGLSLLGKKCTYTDGVLNKLISFATRLFPRYINTKIYSFIIKTFLSKRI